MTLLRSTGLMLALGLAACAPRAVTPPPQPLPQPVQPPPRPVQPVPAAVPLVGWIDAPISAGNWSFRTRQSGPAAEFGTGGGRSFVIACGPGGRIRLERIGAAGGPLLTIRTSAAPVSTSAGEARNLAAIAEPGPPAALAAEIAATDPLLDAISFSRGRFAVEAAGVPQLIIPAWPEAARVVDDCRR